MATIDMTEAQAHFSSLVQRALMGEEIIITRDNKPVARLERLEETGDELEHLLRELAEMPPADEITDAEIQAEVRAVRESRAR
jgi:prevent-host-death family protein